jgi:hypothetical protein
VGGAAIARQPVGVALWQALHGPHVQVVGEQVRVCCRPTAHPFCAASTAPAAHCSPPHAPNAQLQVASQVSLRVPRLQVPQLTVRVSPALQAPVSPEQVVQSE